MEEIWRKAHADAELRMNAWAADGKKIFSAASDGTCKTWDPETGGEIGRIKLAAEGIKDFSLSPDGKRVVSAGMDHTVRIWDLETGMEIVSLRGHAGEVVSCQWSPDGMKILSKSKDLTLRIWSAESGEELCRIPRDPNGVEYHAWHPSGERIVAASRSGFLAIHDCRGREMALFWAEGDLYPFGISPDGRVAVGDRLGNVYLLEMVEASRQPA
jgi:WD40 repeat protein